MQNARLAELEKLLARTSAQPSHAMKSAQFASSEEMNSLKEEIRVVSFPTGSHALAITAIQSDLYLKSSPPLCNKAHRSNGCCASAS
jgi:hypothetical protein